jgi:uncharacterized membrane protein YhfC
MEYSVPTLSIVFMSVVALAGIAIPIILFLIFRKKYKTDIVPFFVGCSVFIVFALMIEGSINILILKSSAGKAIQGNIWLYGIFGGLMAGLFEETGRFTAFKTVLKKYRHNDMNGLMYGAGHGGFEVFYILVFGMVSNIVMAVMLNAGNADKLTAGISDSVRLQSLYAAFTALSTTSPATFLLSIVERFAALALHISLSVLVWFAAKSNGQCFWFYPLAILIHAAVNAVAVILSKYVSSVWIVLFVLYLLTAFCVFVAIKVWQKYATSNSTNKKSITSAKSALLVMILFALIIIVTGCTKDTFSGSKTGNDHQFLVDFDVLNTTVDSKMPLLEGDRIGTTIDIQKGKVDIVVENEDGEFAYRGHEVESGRFTIEIQEAGTYHFVVTGTKAKGSVHFMKR